MGTSFLPFPIDPTVFERTNRVPKTQKRPVKCQIHAAIDYYTILLLLVH